MLHRFESKVRCCQTLTVTLDAVLSQCPWQYHFDSSGFMVLEAYSLPFSSLCPAVPECPYYTYFDLSLDQNEFFNNRELV